MRIFQFVVILLLLIPVPIQARVFTVNSIDDANDLTPGNGLCVAFLVVSPPFVLPFCTLRAAIEEANSLPGTDTIQLPTSTLPLRIEGPGEDLAATGDLDIRDSLIIAGGGADRTIIDGRLIDRIFDIVDENIEVTIKDVSIINGLVKQPDQMSISGGGGVRNLGRLVLQNVAFVGHRAEITGSAGGVLLNNGVCTVSGSTLAMGVSHRGGGIFNSTGSSLQISETTVSGNSAVTGAGLFNGGQLSIVNSTISGNGGGLTSAGGALENNGSAELLFVTIANNKAQAGGGILSPGDIVLQNSLIAENGGGNCFNPVMVFSNGYNLDDDKTCELRGIQDISGVEPQLGVLKNNGGITRTHLLMPTSPARDGGLFLPSVTKDQRGRSRPLGPAVDIGAVENEPFSLPAVILPIITQ